VADLTELQIQSGFKNRLRYVAPAVSMVAIPNAAKRTQWAAHQAKKEGLSAGFPDVMLLAPGGKIGFLEFKTAKGRLTDNQREWIERLDTRGFPVRVVRSIDEALQFLRDHGFPMMESADAA
jgi:hypothetical protein